MFIERVRLAPLCFSAQYVAEMWSVDKILKVLVVINYGGLHIYRLGANPLLLSTFDFHTLVSWQSMNDMLIINIIYAQAGGARTSQTTRTCSHKRSREAALPHPRVAADAQPALQVRGGGAADIVKRMKERGAREGEGGGGERDDDDDDDQD